MSLPSPLNCVAGLLALVLHVDVVCAADETSERGWQYDHGAIVRGDPSEKQLALVFTGSRYGEGTQHILKVLRCKDVKASFFVTGEYLADRSLRGLVGRMVAQGHYVGPHSHGHLLYCPWEERSRSLVEQADFLRDLQKNLAELRCLGALQSEQPIFFIPPFEWFNRDQVRWARGIGVTTFSLTPGTGSNRDYIPEGEQGFVSSLEIIRQVLQFEGDSPQGLNGAVLLLHLGSERHDKLHCHLESLISSLQGRGYRLARIDELLRIK